VRCGHSAADVMKPAEIRFATPWHPLACQARGDRVL
jgi:hypothetical protein